MISIVIPILNEEATIGKLLQHLIENSSPQIVSEIIIVDGGSTDNSLVIIQDFLSGRAESRPKDLSTACPSGRWVLEETKIKFLKSEKGRAKQMNLGTKSATGGILYFLHADSFPPKYFDQLIINEVQKGHLAGCFKMKFESNHWWLKLASWLTQFSWRACRGGDQSQFITKDLFYKIGGYDERFMVYEDNDLIDKLYERKQFVVIQEWLTTSARRYNTNGVWKLQYHFWVIHFKKWFGASSEELLAYYIKHIC
jgi:rSAM/selenodomain-associated transferase 2